jgi:hypothetical protein
MLVIIFDCEGTVHQIFLQARQLNGKSAQIFGTIWGTKLTANIHNDGRTQIHWQCTSEQYFPSAALFGSEKHGCHASPLLLTWFGLHVPFFILRIRSELWGHQFHINAVPLHANQAQRGGTDYSYTMLQLRARRGWWSVSHPGHFTPWKETQYPLYRRLGWPQCQFGQAWKILLTLGFEPLTVQSVASRYTNCANPAVHHFQDFSEIHKQ